MDREPETCTVELTTGSFVHLACKPSQVLSERAHCQLYQTYETANWIALRPFERVVGPGLTGWREVHIDVTQIVAVYPIAGRPEAPMVYSVLAAGGYVPPGS